MGESLLEEKTEPPIRVDPLVSDDSDPLPIPINTPLVESDLISSPKDKKKRMRGCLGTALLIIALIALGTGITYR